MTHAFEKIWVDQCDAAEGIDDRFSRQQAIEYLVGEKFINFLQAAEGNQRVAAEIEAFASRVRELFEPWEISAELDRLQARDCTGDEPVDTFEDLDDEDDEEDLDEPDLDEPDGHDVVQAAAQVMRIERARELLGVAGS